MRLASPPDCSILAPAPPPRLLVLYLQARLVGTVCLASCACVLTEMSTAELLLSSAVGVGDDGEAASSGEADEQPQDEDGPQLREMTAVRPDDFYQTPRREILLLLLSYGDRSARCPTSTHIFSQLEEKLREQLMGLFQGLGMVRAFPCSAREARVAVNKCRALAETLLTCHLSLQNAKKNRRAIPGGRSSRATLRSSTARPGSP